MKEGSIDKQSYNYKCQKRVFNLVFWTFQTINMQVIRSKTRPLTGWLYLIGKDDIFLCALTCQYLFIELNYIIATAL